MPKYFGMKPTGRKIYRRYAKRKITKTARAFTPVAKPSRYFLGMPSTMRVALRCVSQDSVSCPQAGVYGSFDFPLFFPGCWKNSGGTDPKFAGGFLPLMTIYSKAIVRSVKCTTRCMAQSNGDNCNISLYFAVMSQAVSNNQGVSLTLTEFETYGNNKYNVKRDYLSSSDGGRPFCVDTRVVDLYKWGDTSKQNESALYRETFGTGILITSPSVAQSEMLPVLSVTSYSSTTLTSSPAASFLVESVFDFFVEFSGITNLPQQISQLQSIAFSRRT